MKNKIETLILEFNAKEIGESKSYSFCLKHPKIHSKIFSSEGNFEDLLEVALARLENYNNALSLKVKVSKTLKEFEKAEIREKLAPYIEKQKIAIEYYFR
jgi:hypothetical protein